MEWNHEERQKLREKMQRDEFLRVDVTPVLLVYEQDEETTMYLIPATPKEVKILKALNGVICNHRGWEKYEKQFKYVFSKLYDDERECDGEWESNYKVDTHYLKDDGKIVTFPAVTLPPGTVPVLTGIY